MDKSVISKRSFCILSGLGGVAGVVLIMVSFIINSGPPPGTTTAELIKFGQQNYAKVLWGAWLQAVGPVLIVLFAFALVHLAGATQRLPATQAMLARKKLPRLLPRNTQNMPVFRDTSLAK